MKNQIKMAFMAMLLISFASCEKNQVEPKVNENEAKIYHIIGDQIVVETIDLDNLQKPQDSKQKGQNQNSSANGHYTQTNGRTVSFGAMENNSGVHGNTQIHDDFILYNVKLENKQLYIVDNKAVIAGTITHLDPLTTPLLNIGDWIVFAVEDNGEGANADPDRISDGITAIPSFFINFFPPETNWAEAFSAISLTDAGNPTNVQVN